MMRKTLVRLGMGVAATAAALALMAPAAHATEGSDHDDGASTSTKPEGTLLDATFLAPEARGCVRSLGISPRSPKQPLPSSSAVCWPIPA